MTTTTTVMTKGGQGTEDGPGTRRQARGPRRCTQRGRVPSPSPAFCVGWGVCVCMCVLLYCASPSPAFCMREGVLDDVVTLPAVCEESNFLFYVYNPPRERSFSWLMYVITSCPLPCVDARSVVNLI